MVKHSPTRALRRSDGNPQAGAQAGRGARAGAALRAAARNRPMPARRFFTPNLHPHLHAGTQFAALLSRVPGRPVSSRRGSGLRVTVPAATTDCPSVSSFGLTSISRVPARPYPSPHAAQPRKHEENLSPRRHGLSLGQAGGGAGPAVRSSRRHANCAIPPAADGSFQHRIYSGERRVSFARTDVQ